MSIEVVAESINVADVTDGDFAKKVRAATDVPGPANQRATTQACNAVLELVDDQLFNLESQDAGERISELHGHGGKSRAA